jgi:hypothetical protein
LAGEARRVTAANLSVDAHAEDLVGWLERDRIPNVLLKGVARRAALSLYPMADARATLDIDVLVPQEVAADVWQRLRARGYHDPVQPPPDHYHLPSLVNAAGVPVEVHTSTSGSVTAEEAWRRAVSGAEVFERGGLPYRIPSATELLWHAVTHGMQQGPRAFRLRFLLDGAVIVAGRRPIDWTEIIRRLHTAEIPDRSVAVRWLGAATALGGTDLPPGLSEIEPPFALERALAWRLAVFRSGGLGDRLRERLLEEGTRVEAAMPLTPTIAGSSLFARVRRRAAAILARGSYLTWRLASGSVSETR